MRLVLVIRTTVRLTGLPIGVTTGTVSVSHKTARAVGALLATARISRFGTASFWRSLLLAKSNLRGCGRIPSPNLRHYLSGDDMWLDRRKDGG